VAMLRETGWLNFRMRSMLVSVAAYPLWLHWRPVGEWLAREFLDYEPGIHWSQMQMQSGTTGINTTRVYNPVKQAQDHDPQGRFVRHWLPALRAVPDEFIFEPWTLPEGLQQSLGVLMGEDYPMPIVDHLEAARHARDTLWAMRRDPEVRKEAKQVFNKHGSRNPMREGRPRKTNRQAKAAAAGPDLISEVDANTEAHATGTGGTGTHAANEKITGRLARTKVSVPPTAAPTTGVITAPTPAPAAAPAAAPDAPPPQLSLGFD